jgi:centromere/kinetochore protein ZW10
LVNTIATKLISDVFDLSDIGVDEAERIATIISQVETLDDLFLPSQNPNHPSHSSATTTSSTNPSSRSNSIQKEQKDEHEIPLTPSFAPLWLKLKFLSEVLQSNLKDVKYLWFESDLSLYFTAEEVVELIGLSFEMNSGVRALVREIKERPRSGGA